MAGSERWRYEGESFLSSVIPAFAGMATREGMTTRERSPPLPRRHALALRPRSGWISASSALLAAIAELHDAGAHQEIHDREDHEDEAVDQRGQSEELRPQPEAQRPPGDRGQGRYGAQVVEGDLQIVEGQDEADEIGAEKRGPDRRQSDLDEAAPGLGAEHHGGIVHVPVIADQLGEDDQEAEGGALYRIGGHGREQIARQAQDPGVE